jgi:hypothetical protein
MSAYTDTVIANGVDALWLCDTPDANHSTLSANILDVSGNNRHALCFAPSSATNHLHEARATPILTDPGPLVMSGRISSWVDTVNRTTNFAWQGWMYNDGTGPRTMLCRRAHMASTGAAIIGIGGGGGKAVANFKIVDGPYYTLYGVMLINAWNYLVAVYADNMLSLWVNACLAQQINNVVGEVDFSPYSFIGSGNFFIGAQHGRNTFAWFSHGAYGVGFGPSLTEAQIIENYQAAGYTEDCGEPGEPGFRNYCLSIDPEIN